MCKESAAPAPPPRARKASQQGGAIRCAGALQRRPPDLVPALWAEARGAPVVDIPGQATRVQEAHESVAGAVSPLARPDGEAGVVVVVVVRVFSDGGRDEEGDGLEEEVEGPLLQQAGRRWVVDGDALAACRLVLARRLREAAGRLLLRPPRRLSERVVAHVEPEGRGEAGPRGGEADLSSQPGV